MNTAGDVPGVHHGRPFSGVHTFGADIVVLRVAVGAPQEQASRLVDDRGHASPFFQVASEGLVRDAAAAGIHQFVGEILIGVARADLPVLPVLLEAQSRRPDIVLAPCPTGDEAIHVRRVVADLVATGRAVEG